MTKGVEILRDKDLEKMRASCSLAGKCLLMIAPHIRPGITTNEINNLVHEWTLEKGAYPAPLNYRSESSPWPFPKSVCTSVNEVVCHGIPSSYALKDGDIVNVDVTTNLAGFFGDTSLTFYVGQPAPIALKLVETCRQALEAAIVEVKDGARFGNIGAAIQGVVKPTGFSVVDAFVGHGVGRRFHQPPVVHHVGTRGAGDKMKTGMIFTIEPMVNEGTKNCTVLGDGWAAVTADGKLSAQFEHTVRVTKSGCEVLTQRDMLAVNSEEWRAETTPPRLTSHTC